MARVYRIGLCPCHAPGFWERGGYHMLGDPWKEQRYRFSEDDEDKIGE